MLGEPDRDRRARVDPHRLRLVALEHEGDLHVGRLLRGVAVEVEVAVDGRGDRALVACHLQDVRLGGDVLDAGHVELRPAVRLAHVLGRVFGDLEPRPHVLVLRLVLYLFSELAVLALALLLEDLELVEVDLHEAPALGDVREVHVELTLHRVVRDAVDLLEGRVHVEVEAGRITVDRERALSVRLLRRLRRLELRIDRRLLVVSAAQAAADEQRAQHRNLDSSHGSLPLSDGAWCLTSRGVSASPPPRYPSRSTEVSGDAYENDCDSGESHPGLRGRRLLRGRR